MKALAALCFLMATTAHAQRIVDVNNNEFIDNSMFHVVGGQPFVNVKFISLVAGSPYFKDQFMKGKLVGTNGKKYGGSVYRLDMVSNQIHYMQDGTIMISTQQMKEMVLTDSVTNESFHLVHSLTLPVDVEKRGWYLLLTEGRAKLYKFLNKQLMETKPYGSATVEQRIKTNEEFYVLVKDNWVQIKKLTEAVNAFPDKHSELSKYLNALNKGSVSDKLIALVDYYNSLQ